MKTFNFLRQSFTLLFALFAMNIAFAQLFETTFGDATGAEDARDGKELPNGHYMVLSNTHSFGPAHQIMLTELDPAGAVVNVASLTDPGNPNDEYFGNALELDFDNAGNHIGYFITGKIFKGNTDEMILIRTDLGGYMTWAQRINNIANGTVYDERGVSIELQSNGDVIVIGRSQDVNSGLRQMVASRVQANGTVTWVNRYVSPGGDDISPIESCNGIRRFKGGFTVNVVAVTSKWEQAGVVQTFVSLLNANTGNEIWRKTYLSNGTADKGNAIVQNPNNLRYMVVGASIDAGGNQDLWVFTINGFSGNLIGGNTYDLGANYPDFTGRDVCMSLTGNTAVIAGMLHENTPIGGIRRTFALELPFNTAAVPAWFFSYTDSEPNPVGMESILASQGIPGLAPAGYFITTDAFLSGATFTDQHAIRVDGAGLHYLADCPEVAETPVRNAGAQFYAVDKNRDPASWVAFDLETAARDLTEEPCDGVPFASSTDDRSSDIDESEITVFKTEIYPNPISIGTDLSLTFHLEEEELVTVNIFDLTGRKVYYLANVLTAGNQELKVSTQEFSCGIYLVRMATAKQHQSMKLVVSK